MPDDPVAAGQAARAGRPTTQALHIVFVTIDPANDGPKEVGQYAGLFNAPIIGLTGSPAQIDRVKKQYGIFAAARAARGDGQGDGAYGDGPAVRSRGKFAGTIAPDEPDSDAARQVEGADA